MAEQGESIKKDVYQTRINGGKFVATVDDSQETSVRMTNVQEEWGIVPDNKYLLYNSTDLADVRDGGRSRYSTASNNTYYVDVFGAFDSESDYLKIVKNTPRPVGTDILSIEGFDDMQVDADILPLTHNTNTVGVSATRFSAGYFVNLFYSGSLSNSHQTESADKLPVGKYKKGTVLVYTENGVEPSNRKNANNFVGIYESDIQEVATFGVYYVLIEGAVKKGQMLVTSKDGRAKGANFFQRNHIGIAMESGYNNLIKIFIKP